MYRIASLATLLQAQKGDRTVFMRDLREVENRPFPELQMMLQISGHFPRDSRKFGPTPRIRLAKNS